MKLSNKQVNYNCVNDNGTIKLSGAVYLNADNIITQFSGNFTNIETGDYCGDFYYNETADNKINRATNNIPSDLLDMAGDFLLETVAEIKKEVTA